MKKRQVDVDHRLESMRYRPWPPDRHHQSSGAIVGEARQMIEHRCEVPISSDAGGLPDENAAGKAVIGRRHPNPTQLFTRSAGGHRGGL